MAVLNELEPKEVFRFLKNKCNPERKPRYKAHQ